MDIDALRVSHERTWNRLHDLTARRRLSGADIESTLDQAADNIDFDIRSNDGYRAV